KVPGDPRATMEKAQQIRRAAMAPAEPSPQDRRVAAEAARLEAEARAELAQLLREEPQRSAESDEDKTDTNNPSLASAENTVPEDREKAEREADARKESARQFAEISSRNIEINCKLIEIGLVKPPIASGQFFNRQVLMALTLGLKLERRR